MDTTKRIKRRLGCAVLVAAMISLVTAQAASAAVWSGNVVISEPMPYNAAGGAAADGDAANYTLTVSAGGTTTANAVKCIRIEFDTAADGTGGMPTALTDLATATLSGTFTTANTLSTFTPSGSQGANAAAGFVIFTHATGGTGTATGGTVILNGVQNGTTTTPFFMRYNTYNSTGCTAAPQDEIVVQTVWTDATAVAITIDPSLSYTVNAIASPSTCNTVTTTDTSTATAIALKPTLATNKVAGQRHDVATNAQSGYNLKMRFTQPPTSGANSIDPLATATYATPLVFSAAGTESFAFTTSDATLAGGTANRFTNGGAKWAPLGLASPGDTVADASAPVSGAAGQTDVCLQVGMAAATHAGTYSTTIIYTVAGNF